jgi:hypothetical protein
LRGGARGQIGAHARTEAQRVDEWRISQARAPVRQRLLASLAAPEIRPDIGKYQLARLPAISEKQEKAVDGANEALGQGGYGTDSTVQRQVERTLSQVADAARSIRLLADFLNRHPEALVSGRRENEP